MEKREAVTVQHIPCHKKKKKMTIKDQKESTKDTR